MTNEQRYIMEYVSEIAETVKTLAEQLDALAFEMQTEIDDSEAESEVRNENNT